MLIIHDEKVATLVRDIAAREQRPIEQVVEAMATQYATPPASDGVKRLRIKLYHKARAYWFSVQNHARATMTDTELDEQFGGFDEDGIPRFKDELSAELPQDSLAYFAQQAQVDMFTSDDPTLAERTRAIYKQSCTPNSAADVSEPHGS